MGDRVVKRWWAVVAVSSGLFAVRLAPALPGTHPDAVSTFDTRGSSVVLAYRDGLLFQGTSRVFSYNANFTSTSGNFSAQFGAHYLQLKPDPDQLMLHGAAASGTGVFSIPLSSRFINGVPKATLNLYVGVVPMAAVSGPENFLTVPLAIGVGSSLAPTPWLVLSPWVEIAPNINLDTMISELDFTETIEARIDELDTADNTDDITLLTREDIRRVLQKSVDLRFSTHVTLRGGLQALLHLGESFDVSATAMATSFGSYFDGVFIGQVGLGLIYHWDDVVPAVLPAERRLSEETCRDIERRYMMCPNYQSRSHSSDKAQSQPGGVRKSPAPGTPQGPPAAASAGPTPPKPQPSNQSTPQTAPSPPSANPPRRSPPPDPIPPDSFTPLGPIPDDPVGTP